MSAICIVLNTWSTVCAQHKDLITGREILDTEDFNIFKEWDFENRSTGRYTKEMIIEDFDPVGIVYVSPVDIVDDVINGESTQVMRITHWTELWHGFGMTIPIGGPYDELYFSYNWKFGENYNSTHGGKVSGFEAYPIDPIMGPDCPRDGYGYVCKVNFSEANRLYTYHYDRTDHGWVGCPWSTVDYNYAQIFPNNGNWYNITVRLVINSFTNGNGNSDGIFEVWVDGRMVFQEMGLKLLSSEEPDIRINGIELSNYFGGGSENYIPLTECYGYIDNLKVYMPLDDPVTGRSTHDPELILSTPDEITDKTVQYDELITQSGTLTNSEWGGYYSSCIDETYLIDAGEGNNVIFTMDHYELGSGDFLFFYDGNTTDADMIRMISGYEYGDNVVLSSTGRYLFTRFSSNQDFGSLGWKGDVFVSGTEAKPPDTEPPSVPTGLQATKIGVNSIDLSWNAAVDNRAVTGYRVYVDGSFDGPTTTTSYSIRGLSADTPYNISVSAFDAASNESSRSSPIPVRTLAADVDAPTVPTGLDIIGASGNSLNLTWTSSNDNVGVAGYRIFVGGSPVGTSVLNSFAVSGLNSNTSYDLSVSAFDEVSNESAQSVIVTGTTGAPDNLAPTVPTGVTAVSITSNSISLVWDASTDNIQVTGYHIFANGLQKPTAFTNSYTITQLNPGITYNISISAFDASSNESEKSVEISEKTINPDNTLDPTMPAVRTLDVKKSTYSITTTSELTSLGHTELQDFGVRYSKDRGSLKETGTVVYGDRRGDSVSHKDRVKEGLLLLYDFSEGGGTQVLDKNDTITPINLIINKQLNTYWLPGQGLEVSRNTLIYSEDPPTQLFGDFSSTNEITLEAWIKPASLNQSGPVRILTLSSGNDSRAFSLMQEGNVSDFEYVVRLNTSTNGDNGLPEISTDQDFFTLGLHHVVYTRNKKGEEYIYVNGKEKVSGERLGDLGYWAEDNRLALANELNEEKEWIGTFYLIAIYNRALETLEVRKNYEAGFGEVHFTANLESLETNTSYYMSPFVRTDQGIVYGEVEEFMIQNVLHFKGNDSLNMAVVPNPSDGSFVLSFEDSSNEASTAIVRIADMSGQIFFTDVINLGGDLKSYKKDYNLAAIMRSGIYSVILILGSRAKAQRLVIYSD